jgi:hypothetical protein
MWATQNLFQTRDLKLLLSNCLWLPRSDCGPKNFMIKLRSTNYWTSTTYTSSMNIRSSLVYQNRQQWQWHGTWQTGLVEPQEAPLLDNGYGWAYNRGAVGSDVLYAVLHCSPATRRRRRKGSHWLGYNRTILFLGDINTGPGTPGWGSLESGRPENDCAGEDQHIFKRQTHPLVTERMLRKGYDCKCSVGKSYWSWVSRGLSPKRTDWRQTASRKVTMTLSDPLYYSAGGIEYLHRSPASCRRRRKGNSVPGDITGPPCSWGI